MKPNIWPKLNEIHQRWLTNESVVEILKDLIMSIKSDEQDITKCLATEKVNGSSFYSTKKNTNILNNSFSATVSLSPRPQTPPTNLFPAKSPRSPRRILTIDYKKDRNQQVKQVAVSDESCTHVNAQLSLKENQKNYPLSNATVSVDLGSKTSPKDTNNKKFQSNVFNKPKADVLISTIPRFYYAKGKPCGNKENESIISSIYEKLQQISVFDSSIPKAKMSEVVKILNVPFYWKQPVYLCCGGRDNKPLKTDDIVHTWRILLNNCGTDAAKFMHLMTRGGLRNFLERSDFEPLIRDILETHPGLQFLQSSVDFHVHYINTVIARIFFNLDRHWNDRLTLPEIAKSDFLWVLNYLEKHDDINMVTQYFSYEHFYVIYCKFWELDTDHNLIISQEDLAKHNNYAISEKIIDRIFQGTVLRKNASDKSMTYPEFVWFLLAEEDKRHHRSIEYWFRLMDLDGDGVISLYELEFFYQEQLLKMEEMGIEPVCFADCICMILDMVKPKFGDKISLADLKACRLCNIFFDTFFNLPKYLDHEQRDPFTNLKDIEEGLNEMSDWDRYASETYEMLVTEDGQHVLGSDEYIYEDDFESEKALDFRNARTFSSTDLDISPMENNRSAAGRFSILKDDRN